MTPRVEAVAVVVPAHDEEQLLPAALVALLRAVEQVRAAGGPPVDLLVVADACSDATVAVARSAGVRVREVDVRSVGQARAVGIADALARVPGVPRDRFWLATTDADSVVPAGWLAHQLRLADAGADLVLGTVEVHDWEQHPPQVEQQWRAAYDPRDGHRHVHGANTGARADAYLEVGGFAALECEEDVALAAALSHRAVVRTGAVPVVTSARRSARVRDGFAGHLRRLAAPAQWTGSQGSGSTSVELT